MRSGMTMALMLAATPAMAQQGEERTRTIQVVGIASVQTPPDRADLTYWVAGEGKSADAATAALAAKNKAIVEGLSTLLGRDAQVSAGEVSVTEVRGPECEGPGGYNRPRLSEGACAVTGFVATLQGTGRTAAVAKAGTAVGLAARLGARDARVQGFGLNDPAAAQRRATTAAIADARAKAAAMAAGAGVRLGDLLALNDQNVNAGLGRIAEDVGNFPDVSMHSALGNARAVEIAIKPRPIETQARVFARFVIAP